MKLNSISRSLVVLLVSAAGIARAQIVQETLKDPLPPIPELGFDALFLWDEQTLKIWDSNDSHRIILYFVNGNRDVRIDVHTLQNVLLDRRTYQAALLRQVDIIILAGGGNDKIVNETDIEIFAYGGPGNDTLWGGRGVDYLHGDAGFDKLDGREGNDWLWGGDHDDVLIGGRDSDTIHGGAGADTLSGGDILAIDYLRGGSGPDSFRCNRWDQVHDYDPSSGDTCDCCP